MYTKTWHWMSGKRVALGELLGGRPLYQCGIESEGAVASTGISFHNSAIPFFPVMHSTICGVDSLQRGDVE